MKGVESKAESQGQNSRIMSENVEGFQRCVNEIQNPIEQDENFSEMTPEIYDRKKSKLKELVTELSRIHGEETKVEKISTLEQQLTTEVLDLTRKIESIKNQFEEKVKLGLDEIAKRDEQIAELNSQIDLLNNSHAAEVDRLNAYMEKLKKKLEQWCDLDDLDVESLDPAVNVEEYLR